MLSLVPFYYTKEVAVMKQHPPLLNAPLPLGTNVSLIEVKILLRYDASGRFSPFLCVMRSSYVFSALASPGKDLCPHLHQVKLWPCWGRGLSLVDMPGPNCCSHCQEGL